MDSSREQRVGLSDFELIESRADLDALAQDLLGEKILAFDTEADSFYHYFDKTCLVQVATRAADLPDRPDRARRRLGALAARRRSSLRPTIQKIFHAAEYDIYVLKRDCAFQFANLFDTMISAQLLGYPSVGLSSLTERHFGVKLPKDEQRSDWSARPLSSRQQSYAASDVLHLMALAENLAKELRKAKRMRWAEEEFQTLTRREWPGRQSSTSRGTCASRAPAG